MEYIQREQLPFMCGYCLRQFDRISPYCLHIKEHNEAIDDSFHICDKFYGQKDLTYTCKKCQMEFPSICVMHHHLVFCSGSYVFDHEHSIAFPLEDLFIIGRTEEASEEIQEACATELNYKVIDEVAADETNKGEDANEAATVIFDEGLQEYGKDTDNKCAIEFVKLHDFKLRKEKMSFEVEYTQSEDLMDVDHTVSSSKFQEQAQKCIKNSKRNRKTLTVTKNQSNTKDDKSSQDCRKKKGRSQLGVGNRGTTKRFASRLKLKRDRADEELPPSDGKTSSESTDTERSVKSFDNTCTDVSCRETLDNATNETSLESYYSDTEASSSNIDTVIKPKKRSVGSKAKKVREKEWHCEVCGKSWPHRSKLKNHMVSHSDARPHVCQICSSTFKRASNLRSHMITHAAVKPFCCELCGEDFSALTSLNSHKVRKHFKEKKHKCSECGRSFYHKRHLLRHLLSHATKKPHQCEVCGQQFTRKDHLVPHVQIHYNMRRFECTEDGCSKKFFTNYQLQCHLKVHSGERPYKCLICPAEFIQRKELRRHLKKLHKQNLEDLATEYEALKTSNG